MKGEPRFNVKLFLRNGSSYEQSITGLKAREELIQAVVTGIGFSIDEPLGGMCVIAPGGVTHMFVVPAVDLS